MEVNGKAINFYGEHTQSSAIKTALDNFLPHYNSFTVIHKKPKKAKKQLDKKLEEINQWLNDRNLNAIRSKGTSSSVGIYDMDGSPCYDRISIELFQERLGISISSKKFKLNKGLPENNSLTQQIQTPATLQASQAAVTTTSLQEEKSVIMVTENVVKSTSHQTGSVVPPTTNSKTATAVSQTNSYSIAGAFNLFQPASSNNQTQQQEQLAIAVIDNILKQIIRLDKKLGWVGGVCRTIDGLSVKIPKGANDIYDEYNLSLVSKQSKVETLKSIIDVAKKSLGRTHRFYNERHAETQALYDTISKIDINNMESVELSRKNASI